MEFYPDSEWIKRAFRIVRFTRFKKEAHVKWDNEVQNL